ncbi:hypothetical protein PCC7418_1513 [Halothece sp. PCC 7418]|uniref:hypothetical protein n=1 Tax=Halothece sp. (strain PCC 7418) TaxID=65093 RepID=UPI0002A05AF2|nr:hypothetical protein [Halothece sp. PCC 7418]AFZ43702.1 hypothetical protein PCC7418_1513 [Halothece sp. PCC 7418]
MGKSTQAHLERTINKDQPLEARQQELKKMNYYMGAKLLEVGVDPQSPEILYRWSIKTQGNQQFCTLSAFWGDSKAKLLSGEHPLTGEELIDCAKANVSKGVATAAQLCGFASDLDRFRTALKDTMAEMGIEDESLQKLLSS